MFEPRPTTALWRGLTWGCMALLLALVSAVGGTARESVRTLAFQGIRQAAGHSSQSLGRVRGGPLGASVREKACEAQGLSSVPSLWPPFGWGWRSDVGLPPALGYWVDDVQNAGTSLVPTRLTLDAYRARAPPSKERRI